MSARLLGPSAFSGALIGVVSALTLSWPVCLCCGPATMAGAFGAALLIGVLNRGIGLGQGVVSGLICGVTAAVIFSAAIRFHPGDEHLAQLLQAVEKGLEQQKAKAPSREFDTVIQQVQHLRRNLFELRVSLGLWYSFFAVLAAPIAGLVGALVFGRRPAPPPPVPLEEPPPPGPES